MLKSGKIWVVVAMGAILMLGAAVMAFGASGFVSSEAQAADDSLPRTITVVGEGTVNIKPDIVNTNIGVEMVKPSLKEAVGEARQTMNAVMLALKEQGVEEKDIQTSGFSIWIERPYSSEGASMDTENMLYHVSNQASVNIRDMDKVEDVLSAAIDAGANNIYGINFSVDDPSKLESEARKKAVADAKAKADELASFTGVKVGQVVGVSEVIGGGGGYYAGGFNRGVEMASGMGGGGGGPISPGELKLTLNLQVTYSIQ